MTLASKRVKSSGLVDLVFGYTIVTIYLSGVANLDLQTRVFASATLGGLIGATFAFLDPIAPIVFLIGRHSLRRSRTLIGFLMRDHKRSIFGEAELVRETLSSPFLEWAKTRITSGAYLAITIGIIYLTGTATVLLPAFHYVLPVVGFIIIAKVFLELRAFLAKVRVVSVYNLLISSQDSLNLTLTEENILVESMKGLHDAISQGDWPRSISCVQRIVNLERQKPAGSGPVESGTAHA